MSKTINYLSQNRKMKKSTGEKIFNFGIPAYKTQSGRITCPMAGTCLKGCYAQAGAYTWSNVKNAYERRYELTKTRDHFVQTISDEIQRRKIKRVRIHDSGDFYSLNYLAQWIRIMRRNPETQFYAYTKMVKMFKETALCLPENFTVIYSYGGKQDSLINPEKDRHSAVFSDEESLKSFGYANASHDDTIATGQNHKIGLVFHGPKSRKWEASA